MSAAGTASRFIDVFEHARLGVSVEGSLPLAGLVRLRPSLAVTDGELAFAYQGLTDEHGRPAARLAFRGQIALTCDRCGLPVMQELAGEAQYFFVRTDAELARLPIDESIEEPLLGSARFDLHELIEDEAILALPISPRHAGCTTAQEEHVEPAGPTAEAGDDRPHPFAALAQLKSRRQ